MGEHTMGKERVGGIIAETIQSQCRLLSQKQYVQSEISKGWSLNSNPVSLKEINEDGEVMITVKNGEELDYVLVTGLPNEGITESFIIAELKRQKAIKRTHLVESMFIFKNMVWTPFDMVKDTFRSGDSIMINIKLSLIHI
eukprot:TRINITY_DN1194_c0_g2_i8.p1 TRINITY_DN1194_c0_g2~~TRINITY_DN1194_c0_g2_i8.p1  ORF type:complete len:141 (+),score=31.13 TRINITY_DN1194_c0_g2_i8:101-523(+)